MIREGDIGRLEKILYEDVLAVSDGVGKAATFIKPVEGRNNVLALSMGLSSKYFEEARVEFGEVNHMPALFYLGCDQPATCQILINRCLL